jgi:hypothetical protein
VKAATIPFPRQFGPNANGYDCRGVKIALAEWYGSANGMGLKTNTFGKPAQFLLEAFKGGHGLLTDAVYTLQAHQALQPYFTSQAASLMVKEYDILTAENQRAAYVNALQWFIFHHQIVSYAETRPIPLYLPAFELQETIFTDCSGMVTLAAKWAGVPDPNGYGFDGYGNTGSLYAHCKHVPEGSAAPGDLVWFGRPGETYGQHAIGIVAKVPGGDFDVASNGFVGDPIGHTYSSVSDTLAAEGYTEAVFLRFLPVP